MLFRPEESAEGFEVTVHTELPETWPSAADPGDAHCHIFQTREFIAAWRSSFGRSTRFRPLFVEVAERPGGRPLLLLPWVIERRRGIDTLGFIDQGQSDYNAPVLFPALADHLDAFTAAFWEGLFAQLPAFDVLQLDKMPADIDGLKNPLAAFATGPHAQSCHGNDLTRPLKEIEGVLLSPKELRQKQRGLEKIAPVQLLVAETPAERQRLLEKLIIQKQRRFDETRVPGYAENPNALAFLRAADRAFGTSGNSFICALEVGDEITAAQWGLVHGKRLYALVTGFEGGAWTKFSCGRILNLRLLQWLNANGFTYFDQGYGDEPYKLRSSDTTVPLFDKISARTGRGRRHLARRALIAGLKAHPAWERSRQLKWVILRRLKPSSIDGPGQP